MQNNKLTDFVLNLCGRPSFRWYLLLLAALLSLPSLWVGLQVDDFYHASLLLDRLLVSAPNAPGSVSGLFTFFDGNEARLKEMVQQGMAPWWADPAVKISFWRPVSELSHWLDYTLWPNSPIAMHIHNVFWYLLSVLVFLLLVDLISAKSLVVVGLTGFLFALDYGHGFLIGWVANRSIFIAFILSVGSFYFYVLWLSGKNTVSLLASLVLFAIALLAAESAISITAYLFSFALFVAQGSLLKRGLSLVPFALIVMVWRVIYVSLGYGTYSTVFYLDPIGDFSLFATQFLERAIVLLTSQFFFPPAEIYSALPTAVRVPYLIISVALLGVFFFASYGALRSSQYARFWLVGCLLSVIPVCATIPGSRLLFFVSMGAAGFLAQVFLSVFDSINRDSQSEQEGGFTRRVIAVVFSFNCLLSLFAFPLSGWTLPLFYHDSLNSIVDRIPLETEDREKTVVLLNPPVVSQFLLATHIREITGQVNGQRTLLAASNSVCFSVRKMSATSFEVGSISGIMHPLADVLFRHPSKPIKLGEQFHFEGFIVTVTALTESDLIKSARFDFDRSLEDDSILFLMWRRGGGFEPYQFKSVGVSQKLSEREFSFSCEGSLPTFEANKTL